MIRRSFLKRLAVLPLAAAAVPSNAGAAGARLKIMMRGLHHTNQWIILIAIAILLIAVYLVSEPAAQDSGIQS
jgi:hypothetical protein